MTEPDNATFYPGVCNQALMAAAGTGKTFSVAMRFIRLVYNGAKPSAILAATFTNKAAGEIFDKIITELLRCILNPNHLEDLRRSEKLPESIRKEDLLAILRELLTGSGSLQIGTLDSFFLKILQAFPSECGVWDRIRITDEKDDRLRVPAIAELFQNMTEENANQIREAVKAACSGKESTTLFEKMLQFTRDICALYRACPETDRWGNPRKIWSAYREEWILSDAELKETVKAAEEETKLLEDKRTRDSLLGCIRYIPEYRTVTGQMSSTPLKVPGRFQQENPGFPFSETEKLVYVFNRRKTDLTERLSGLLKKLTLHLIGSVFRDKTAQTSAVAELMMQYDRLCGESIRQNGHLSFEDVPALLKEHSEALMGMEERLDARFRHYILDEFQDTSTLQWQMLEPLVEEVLTGNDGEKRSFFYVGDIKQSIYQWRKGNPELFEQIADKYRFCGERKVNLEKPVTNISFRSSLPVLDLVNKVFSDDAPPAGDPCIDQAFQRLEFRPHEPDKHSAAKQNGVAAVIRVPVPEGEERMVLRARAIFASLMKIRPFGERDLSVGVLVLKNKTANLIADELKRLSAEKKADLPVTVQGKLDCTGTMPSFIASLLLRLAFHPSDPLGKSILPVLTMEEGDGTSRPVTPLLLGEWLGSPQPLSSREELSSFLRRCFEKEGCLGILRRFRKGVEEKISPPELERLEALENEAAAFDREEQGTPDEFLDTFAWRKAVRSSLTKTVQIMTVHASKGLDFDVVYLPELWQDKGINAPGSPSLPACRTDSDFEPEWLCYLPRKEITAMIPPFAEFMKKYAADSCYEDLCCLYVAMTRARHAAYILADPEQKNTWHLEKIVCLKTGEGENIALREEMEKELNREWEQEEPLTVTWVSGDPCWYKDPGKNMKSIDPEAKESFEERERVLKKFRPEKVTLLPSRKMRKKTASGEEKMPAAPGGLFASRRSASAGSRVHAVLAEIDWIDPSSTPDSVLEPYLKPGERGTGLEELLVKALASPSFRELFRRPEKLYADPPWREKAFLVRSRREKKEYVPGVCDRVVLFRETPDGPPVSALIADFKTDQLDNEESFRNRYGGQLQLYRESVAALTGLPEERIRCQIVSVRLGRCFDV